MSSYYKYWFEKYWFTPSPSELQIRQLEDSIRTNQKLETLLCRIYNTEIILHPKRTAAENLQEVQRRVQAYMPGSSNSYQTRTRRMKDEEKLGKLKERQGRRFEDWLRLSVVHWGLVYIGVSFGVAVCKAVFGVVLGAFLGLVGGGLGMMMLIAAVSE